VPGFGQAQKGSSLFLFRFGPDSARSFSGPGVERSRGIEDAPSVFSFSPRLELPKPVRRLR